MLEAISDVVDVVGPELLNLEQLGQAFQRFKQVLDGSKQRRLERLQRRQAEDFDEDEAEAIEVLPLPAVPPTLWGLAVHPCFSLRVATPAAPPERER